MFCVTFLVRIFVKNDKLKNRQGVKMLDNYEDMERHYYDVMKRICTKFGYSLSFVMNNTKEDPVRAIEIRIKKNTFSSSVVFTHDQLREFDTGMIERKLFDWVHEFQLSMEDYTASVGN